MLYKSWKKYLCTQLLRGTIWGIHITALECPEPGGGGTQIWVGQGCAAQASKPIPIFKGDLAKKGTYF